VPIDRATIVTLRRRLLNGLESVAVELTNQAKVRATSHVFTGERRQSITHTRRTNDVLWGMPFSQKNAALEFGFTPHWVPGRYIGTWMQRNNVGVTRAPVKRGKRRGKPGRIIATALGLYVGGPNSRLDQGPGQPGGMQFAGGRRRVFRRWNTRGQRSPDLKPNTVGHSVLKWTIRTRLRAISVNAFARGYQRG
jgi:hypothetical protein